MHISSPHRTAIPRIGATIGVTALLVAIAAPAFAHVKVSGIDATQGGYGVLTFRVPSESATASTTALTVHFPSTSPISSADTQPKRGWTATVITKHLKHPIKTEDGTIDTYVSAVKWKAKSASAAIPPGEFDMFNLSVGPLPDASALMLPSTQRYSDGTVVRWNEKAASGGVEPAHPAPVLHLAPAESAGADAAGDHDVAVAAAREPRDETPVWPGYAGLAAGILGLLAGVTALIRANQK